MSNLPPIVTKSDFVAVKKGGEEALRSRFIPFIRELHMFLNRLPCLADLQDARKKWKSRVKYQQAFGENCGFGPNHWYTFNNGGRNESQFNIALLTTHFRIGLGFEFTHKNWGKPSATVLAYACFLQVIKNDLKSFHQLLNENSLEVEWVSANNTNELKFISTKDVSQCLMQLSSEPTWIFIGRLLRPETDLKITQDASQLKEIIESVFSGFRPIWEKTQEMAAI